MQMRVVETNIVCRSQMAGSVLAQEVAKTPPLNPDNYPPDVGDGAPLRQ
jgi:hypothetical protein